MALTPRQRQLAMLRRRNAALRRQLQASKNDPWRARNDAWIQQEASRRTNARMQPEEDKSKMRTKADLAAIAGYGAAAAQLLQQSAPRIQEGFQKAAETQIGAGQGFTGEMKTRIEAAQQQAAEFAQSQGQAPANVTPAGATSNAVYKGFYDSGSNMALGGAVSRRAAEQDVGVQGIKTQEDLIQRQRMGEEELIELASKRPDMRNEILDELYKRELDKLQGRLSIRQQKVQERAQSLYEKQFGLDIVAQGEKGRHNRASEGAALTRAQIAQNNYLLQVDKHQRAIKNAEKEGRKPNNALSISYGYIVDSNGNPIKDKNGKRIPVKSTAKGGGKGADGLTPAQRQERFEQASKDAEDMFAATRPGPRPYPDMPESVVNKPKPPKSKMTFAGAQTILMRRYGINRARARQILISVGWKPDGKRSNRRVNPDTGRYPGEPPG